jgi:hypothetical protein
MDSIFSPSSKVEKEGEKLDHKGDGEEYMSISEAQAKNLRRSTSAPVLKAHSDPKYQERRKSAPVVHTYDQCRAQMISVMLNNEYSRRRSEA